MPKKEVRKFNLLFFLYPILAAILSFAIKANYFFSIILFFGVPSLILSFKNKKLIKKAALFSLILGFPMTLILDHMAHRAKAWFILQSVLPFRLFGTVTGESILWGFLIVYFIVMYYEYFLEHKLEDKLYAPNLKYLMMLFFGLFLLFLTVLITNPTLLCVDYFYLKAGLLLGLLPILSVLFQFPNLLTKFFKTGTYFFYLTFIMEITALKLGQWTFPGEQFLGWVTLFGVAFPFEELFFWMILGAIAILSYYEFFDDDRK